MAFQPGPPAARLDTVRWKQHKYIQGSHTSRLRTCFPYREAICFQLVVHPSQWRGAILISSSALKRVRSVAVRVLLHPKKGSLRHMVLSCVSPEVRRIIQEMRDAVHEHLLQVFIPLLLTRHS